MKLIFTTYREGKSKAPTFSHKNLLEWGIKRPRPASFRRALVNLSTLNDNQKTYVLKIKVLHTNKRTKSRTGRTEQCLLLY